MKIQVLSDLHLEHGGFLPEHHPEADVIVLAGDLAPYTEGLVDQLAEHWSGAPHILYVLGNHEFYGTEIDETRARLVEECAGAGIHLLDPGMVRIEGTRFIGATLWTDLLLEGKADEIGAHMRVSREISDFRGAIQHQGRDFSTGESVERHRADRAFIERELEEAEHAGDRAVVTSHHAPSPRSIQDWYEGESIQLRIRIGPGPGDRAVSARALDPRPHARSGGRTAWEDPGSSRILQGTSMRGRPDSIPRSASTSTQPCPATHSLTALPSKRIDVVHGKRSATSVEPQCRDRHPVRAVHWLLFLWAVSLARAASAETWRGLSVPPEHQCSPYEK